MVFQETIYREAGRLLIRIYRLCDLNEIECPLTDINARYLKACGAADDISEVNKAFYISEAQDLNAPDVESQWFEHFVSRLNYDTALLGEYIQELKHLMDDVQVALTRRLRKILFSDAVPLRKAEALRAIEAARRVSLFVDLELDGKMDSSHLATLLSYSDFFIDRGEGAAVHEQHHRF